MKKYLFAVSFASFLLILTLIAVLSTFVIERRFSVVTADVNESIVEIIDDLSGNGVTETESVTDSDSEPETDYGYDAENETYTDENYTIKLSRYTENDITVSSVKYLKTALAENTYGRNITSTTSETAEEHGAVLAINGDYYGSRESGYVIRNGVVYRNTASGNDVLCIMADGSFMIVSSSEYTTDELVELGVWQAFCFGPGLVENGLVTVDSDDEVGRAKASNPRTAIGIIDENHYVFVVSDGRTEESEGLSLLELAEFMQSLWVETAYNLDGGGSSTMYFMGEIVNNPTTSGRKISEREVSDMVDIG